jgi:hypothetical protein
MQDLPIFGQRAALSDPEGGAVEASSELVVAETLPRRAAFAPGLASTGSSQSTTNAYPAWAITQFEEGAR